MSLSDKLGSVQGNILGGFNKDFQDFLFLRFKSAKAGRAWIKEIADADNEIGVATSSSSEVVKFNAQFKALRKSGFKPEDFISAAWTNLALTFAGMTALGIKQADRNLFPLEFKQGMAARKTQVGDVGTSDPSHWVAPFDKPAQLHAVLIVAADGEQELASRIAAIRATPAFTAGVTVIGAPVEGRTRVDEPGHEHFGFKDGVSQPGIRGLTVPDDPIGNPDQGQPGQDLLWPGEFVLGLPKQIPTPKAGVDGPNPDPGTDSTSGPSWTVNGSYLVFRRLAQDVPAFIQEIAALAAASNLHPDLMGAKLVGRYKSGCPIERRAFEPEKPVAQHDPGKTQPALADDDTLNNNFEFGDDEAGSTCPIAAHIRKAYPRDEQTLPNKAASESSTQTHRLLRRGIPFGKSFGSTQGGTAADPRGLLFLCYQQSIVDQFEFVQSRWVNDPEFPGFPAGRQTPGEDPIITQSPQGPFTLDPAKPPVNVKHFVTTTGGEYFFTPSIEALQDIGAGKH